MGVGQHRRPREDLASLSARKEVEARDEPVVAEGPEDLDPAWRVRVGPEPVEWDVRAPREAAQHGQSKGPEVCDPPCHEHRDNGDDRDGDQAVSHGPVNGIEGLQNEVEVWQRGERGTGGDGRGQPRLEPAWHPRRVSKQRNGAAGEKVANRAGHIQRGMLAESIAVSPRSGFNGESIYDLVTPCYYDI